MEGVTDETYRLAINEMFPAWSYYSTDFLRIPKNAHIPKRIILKHFGQQVFAKKELSQKTSYQILASPEAPMAEVVQKISDLNFHHLDLNLGCPSKKVNAHRGGAFLLSDLKLLQQVLREIRTYFSGFFSVKIRVGYKDDRLFEDIIHLIEDEGVEAITIHGRTREQAYKGKANWDYIKRAVQLTSLPIIGNGDIWTPVDVERMFDYTNCHSVMLGRGAMKTPWIAETFEENKNRIHMINDELLLFERCEYIQLYFITLLKKYRDNGLDDDHILKRFKGLSHQIFLDYKNGETIRSLFLRSREINEYLMYLNQLDKLIRL